MLIKSDQIYETLMFFPSSLDASAGYALRLIYPSVKVIEVYSHLVGSELHNAVNKITLRLN